MMQHAGACRGGRLGRVEILRAAAVAQKRFDTVIVRLDIQRTEIESEVLQADGTMSLENGTREAADDMDDLCRLAQNRQTASLISLGPCTTLSATARIVQVVAKVCIVE